ncbi:glycosyltransferase [Rhizomonospora bruguierae]|uniref:glycosyltransferase n=1 Tax=Rhizomonospora bruguierae TaxID=1581705 RepID=UPI001BCE68AA|nr:glycosyltransferase [Micromonospora sp. NBRC 107566]
MRIAMVSEHASPLAALGGEDAGGQNAHVAQLAAALALQGHDVRVYTRRDDAHAPVAVPAGPGVEVVHVPAGPPEPLPKDALPPFMPVFARWLVGHWRADGWLPTAVHAHFWMSGLAAVDAARPLNLPVVLTYHALGSVKRRHQGTRDTSPADRIDRERRLGRTVDRVVVQCRDEVDELVRLGVPPARLTLIPSGVDERRFHPDGPAAPRATGRPRVLSVGRLVERKGFADLVHAMRDIPDAECVIVGGPLGSELDAHPYARELRELAARLGLADRVTLVGGIATDAMPDWYRSADVLAAAPWYEPFGLTPIEAMACGVPVVGTAVGGLRDTVHNAVTGHLVPPRDPGALAAALRDLLAHPARRDAYALAARNRVVRRYSWRRAASDHAALYAAVRRPSTVTAQREAVVR